MILVRAPLRISFIGGGTDLPSFYHLSPGRVISTSINQYVYIAINPTELINKISVRYSITETVRNIRDLQHNRVREALSHFGINNNIEVASFASVPMRTGLGSSSSFTVALLKGLSELLGKKINNTKVAELACHIEIDKVGEPIGRQDQYASALGGFNVLEFGRRDKVSTKPVKLSKDKKKKFENSLLLFYTGITRDASSVLGKQSIEVKDHIKVYKQMAEMVWEFERLIKSGSLKEAGKLLHQSWELKKSLTANISNRIIDDLYNSGTQAGAWGGKILGAGGGGCVLFMTDPRNHNKIRKAVRAVAASHQLKDFREIPINFEEEGVRVLFNSN